MMTPAARQLARRGVTGRVGEQSPARFRLCRPRRTRHFERELPGFVGYPLALCLSGPFGIGRMVRGIICKVTGVAHCPQVIVAAVLGNVV
jgi:hypothetical protein